MARAACCSSSCCVTSPTRATSHSSCQRPPCQHLYHQQQRQPYHQHPTLNSSKQHHLTATQQHSLITMSHRQARTRHQQVPAATQQQQQQRLLQIMTAAGARPPLWHTALLLVVRAGCGHSSASSRMTRRQHGQPWPWCRSQQQCSSGELVYTDVDIMHFAGRVTRWLLIRCSGWGREPHVTVTIKKSRTWQGKWCHTQHLAVQHSSKATQVLQWLAGRGFV